MPELVLVRNKAQGPTVFQDPLTKESYEWGSSGDQYGEDVQYVPDTVLQNPHFRRNIERGIFVVEEASAELLALYGEQAAKFRRDQQAEIDASIEHIDQQANNDIIGISCIGPGPRGGECGSSVPIREKDLKDRPPLCQMHSHLGSEFVPTAHPTEIDEKGNATTIWVRAAFTPHALPSQQ